MTPCVRRVGSDEGRRVVEESLYTIGYGGLG